MTSKRNSCCQLRFKVFSVVGVGFFCLLVGLVRSSLRESCIKVSIQLRKRTFMSDHEGNMMRSKATFSYFYLPVQTQDYHWPQSETSICPNRVFKSNLKIFGEEILNFPKTHSNARIATEQSSKTSFCGPMWSFQEHHHRIQPNLKKGWGQNPKNQQKTKPKTPNREPHTHPPNKPK